MFKGVARRHDRVNQRAERDVRLGKRGKVLAGRIILFNGVGSSGKSTAARALQSIARRPLLHVQMDTFLEMAPPAPDAFLFQTREHPEGPEVEIVSTALGDQLMTAMLHAVAAMAQSGADLILDDVMTEDDKAASLSHYAGLRLTKVGFFAPLDVLEARERARGDRMIGLARWQIDRVHEGMTYDLTVDSAAATPEGIARQICDALDL